MDNSIVVSVVIPVYKTEKYLKNAVDSILNQTYKNTEIILVDDGSPDKCPIICDELVADNSNISVIHKENGGLSSARNAGIEKASGKYILFLDSDDALECFAIEEMVQIAEMECSDAVMPNLYYKVYENKKEKKSALLFEERMFTSNPLKFALNVQIGFFRGYRSTAVLYRLSLLKEKNIRFPYGMISEDFFYNLDFMSVAKKISLIKKPTLLNLKHSGSISMSFQKNYADVIWLIDDYAFNFIKNIDNNNKNSVEKVDALLCRNIVTYLFSIMSSHNLMTYNQKRRCAYNLLNDKRCRNVWKKRNRAPYFESKITTMVFRIVFVLLRLNLVDIALALMAMR